MLLPIVEEIVVINRIDKEFMAKLDAWFDDFLSFLLSKNACYLMMNSLTTRPSTGLDIFIHLKRLCPHQYHAI